MTGRVPAALVATLLATGLAACSNGSSGEDGQTRLALGDATHRPVLPDSGQQPAPARLAKPLLTPAELGATWRYGFNPPVTLSHPPKPVDTPAPAYRVLTALSTEHWNGTSWYVDQNVIEQATRYASSADARLALHGLLHLATSCNTCSAETGYQPVRLAGRRIWHREGSDEPGSAEAVLLRGPVVIRILVGSPHDSTPGVMPADTILRAAVKRLAAG